MNPTDNTTDNFKTRLNQDLKTALLAGDKATVEVLRGLKSAVLYVEVAKGARDAGLPESEVQAILSKEAKKRQESADLYTQGNRPDRAAAELSEKAIIERYLPAQLSEAEISDMIDAIETEQGALQKPDMGTAIAAIKQRSQGAVDGAVVARLVKARIAAHDEADG